MQRSCPDARHPCSTSPYVSRCVLSSRSCRSSIQPRAPKIVWCCCPLRRKPLPPPGCGLARVYVEGKLTGCSACGEQEPQLSHWRTGRRECNGVGGGGGGGEDTRTRETGLLVRLRLPQAHDIPAS